MHRQDGSSSHWPRQQLFAGAESNLLAKCVCETLQQTFALKSANPFL